MKEEHTIPYANILQKYLYSPALDDLDIRLILHFEATYRLKGEKDTFEFSISAITKTFPHWKREVYRRKFRKYQKAGLLVFSRYKIIRGKRLELFKYNPNGLELLYALPRVDSKTDTPLYAPVRVDKNKDMKQTLHSEESQRKEKSVPQKQTGSLEPKATLQASEPVTFDIDIDNQIQLDVKNIPDNHCWSRTLKIVELLNLELAEHPRFKEYGITFVCQDGAHGEDLFGCKVMASAPEHNLGLLIAEDTVWVKKNLPYIQRVCNQFAKKDWMIMLYINEYHSVFLMKETKTKTV